MSYSWETFFCSCFQPFNEYLSLIWFSAIFSPSPFFVWFVFSLRDVKTHWRYSLIFLSVCLFVSVYSFPILRFKLALHSLDQSKQYVLFIFSCASRRSMSHKFKEKYIWEYLKIDILWRTETQTCIYQARLFIDIDSECKGNKCLPKLYEYPFIPSIFQIQRQLSRILFLPPYIISFEISALWQIGSWSDNEKINILNA